MSDAKASLRAAGSGLSRALAVAAGLAYLSLSRPTVAESPVPRIPPGGPGAEVTPQEAGRLREELRRVIDNARDKVFPALANIEVVTMSYYEGREYKGRAVGSGTIISKDGYVLTNHHVVHNGVKYTCTLSDKQEVPARLVGEDPLTDLAVLQLAVDKIRDPEKVLRVAEFGDSATLQIGDYVMAMGSPFALSRSVTLGIVSNTERVLSDSDEDMELFQGQRTGLFNQWIQHDALINPGNSGGPLVNLAGEVIGVNARGGSSMGFAIPSNLARFVADNLIKSSEVTRSMFGVTLRSIKDTGYDKGVLVTSVTKNSPADKAGLRAGDLVLSMGGQDATVRFPDEIPLLAKRIADYPVGQSVGLVVRRDGKEEDKTLLTEKLKKDRGEERAFRGWGLTGLEITDFWANELALGSTDGVFVTGAKNGGPAQVAEPAIQNGDVIKAVDGKAVKSLREMIAAYDGIMGKDALPDKLLVEFDRKGKSFVTLINPRPDKENDPPRELAKAWIGIDTQPITAKLAKALGCEGGAGFRVTRIYPGTIAAESSLKVGDVITAIGEEKTVPRGQQDAAMIDRILRKLDIDQDAKLTVMRCSEKSEISIKLERTRLTQAEARRDHNHDFEVVARELTFFDRDENRWAENTQGVVVQEVERAGWAGLGGLASGDLIQKIQSAEIKDLDTYRKAMKDVADSQPERIEMVVLRGVRTQFIFIEPDWKPVPEQAAKTADANSPDGGSTAPTAANNDPKEPTQ